MGYTTYVDLASLSVRSKHTYMEPKKQITYIWKPRFPSPIGAHVWRDTERRTRARESEPCILQRKVKGFSGGFTSSVNGLSKAELLQRMRISTAGVEQSDGRHNNAGQSLCLPSPSGLIMGGIIHLPQSMGSIWAVTVTDVEFRYEHDQGHHHPML